MREDPAVAYCAVKVVGRGQDPVFPLCACVGPRNRFSHFGNGAVFSGEANASPSSENFTPFPGPRIALLGRPCEGSALLANCNLSPSSGCIQLSIVLVCELLLGN